MIIEGLYKAKRDKATCVGTEIHGGKAKDFVPNTQRHKEMAKYGLLLYIVAR